MNHTYPEMKSQYAALQKTFDAILGRKNELLEFFKERAPQSLTYIGCGSSYYLCQSAELSARLRLGIPASAMASGDLMLNYGHYAKLLTGTMLIAPTRSGSTSEVLMAIANAKSRCEIPVLAITCVANSAITHSADFSIELPWAFDESVCQTRTVTNLYAANLLILAILSRDDGLIRDIETAIQRGDGFMLQYEAALNDLAGADWCDALVLADGELQGIACEGALAFMEIGRIPGRYYHLLDVRHGPMVLVNEKTLAIIVLNSKVSRYQIDLVRDFLKKGARVVVYSDLPIPPLEGVTLQITSGVRLDEAAQGLPFIFIPQALAYYKAIRKGIDPDQPEGLDAWIKL